MQKGTVVLLDVPGQAEICQFELPTAVDQNVRRFDIPVDHSLVDQTLQPRPDLPHDVQSTGLLQFILPEVTRQVHRAVLHHHEQRVVLLEDIVQFDDIGVVEGSQDGGLVFDGSDGVLLEGKGQFFDGVGRGVVDFAEGALPED